MRLPVFAAIAFILLCLLVDFYIYRVISRRCHNRTVAKIHVALTVLMLAGIIVTISLPRRSGSDVSLVSIMWMLYAYASVYIPKIFFVAVDLIASIPELFRRRRVKWLSVTGMVAAIAIFVTMWWGALVNRFNIDVNEVEVEIENLPDSFDGYRVVQFSDLHTGTYGTDTAFVADLVDRLNTAGGDIIVFTGDIVNRNSAELKPFVAPLSRLHAPDGVYAILGNHDYGDYMNWSSDADKQRNMQLLYDLYGKTGADLILNETRTLHRGNDSIALIGVENIGDPPFKVYGSLTDAYPTPGDSVTKILLTHNPAHWTNDIMNNDSVNIALTLSGHTHAMQMMAVGITPASLRYKTSHGLYTDSLGRNLYVNIGAGTVGIPTRIGATPEITVITLRKAK